MWSAHCHERWGPSGNSAMTASPPARSDPSWCYSGHAVECLFPRRNHGAIAGVRQVTDSKNRAPSWQKSTHRLRSHHTSPGVLPFECAERTCSRNSSSVSRAMQVALPIHVFRLFLEETMDVGFLAPIAGRAAKPKMRVKCEPNLAHCKIRSCRYEKLVP